MSFIPLRTSLARLEWLPAAVTDHNMSVSALLVTSGAQETSGSTHEDGERGVSEAKKDKRSRFQQIHQVHQTTYSLLTRKQRVKPYCFHLVCRSAQGEKAFHAPTVDQSLSTDPGRITKEPICVR